MIQCCLTLTKFSDICCTNSSILKMNFPINFESIIIAILGLFLLIQLFYYWFYFGRLLFCKASRKEIRSDQPPVSVVICAKNEEENLKEYLPKVLKQDYPNFQVVVVNDCSSDETEEYLKLISGNYPHLYFTTIKQDPIFTHGKKLALTIGIKAAKHDLLLLTDADCYPSSNKWLATMVRNFTPKTDIVLGYAPYKRLKGFLNHFIAYDTYFTAVQYFGYAAAKQPYMGVGRNLAYRKSLFFKYKGFASHSHIQSGDDDLFINQAAESSNVRIECTPDAQTISIPETRWTKWFLKKRRHLTTGKHYKKSHKFRLGMELLSRQLFYISVVTALFFPLGLWVGLGAYAFRLLHQIIILNLIAKKLKERYFFVGIVIYDILMPITYGILAIRNVLQPKIKWK